MKATLDIPDDLYRQVKARSALEGRPIRAVAVQLFQNWLNAKPAARKSKIPENAPWLAITREYVRPEMNHDLAEIHTALAQGWETEIKEKKPLL